MSKKSGLTALGAVGMFVLILLLLVGVIALNGLIIMVLWGIIAAELGWTTISFGVAVAISVLISFIGGLFKGVSR